MEEILLTKEQMNELESVGLDVSDAKLYTKLETIDGICRDVSLYSYSVTDILRKLPRFIQPFLNYDVCIANGNNEDKWKLRIYPFTTEYWIVSYVRNEYVPKDNGYCDDEYHRDDTFHSEIGKTLLEALFKMLKWLKEEETKKDKVKYLNC